MAHKKDILDIVSKLQWDFQCLVEQKQYVDIVQSLLEKPDDSTLNHIDLLVCNYKSVEEACLENIDHYLDRLADLLDDSE
jgi:hypothetical protein